MRGYAGRWHASEVEVFGDKGMVWCTIGFLPPSGDMMRCELSMEADKGASWLAEERARDPSSPHPTHSEVGNPAALCRCVAAGPADHTTVCIVYCGLMTTRSCILLSPIRWAAVILRQYGTASK